MAQIQSMNTIKNLKIWELKSVLKQLKLYWNLSKKIGNRWKRLFHRTLNNTHSYKIEYMPSMWKEIAWNISQKSFQKAFWILPNKEDVAFVENTALLGGIKIFQDDAMLDLSLSMVAHQIAHT